jgi:hypothetical protein
MAGIIFVARNVVKRKIVGRLKAMADRWFGAGWVP